MIKSFYNAVRNIIEKINTSNEVSLGKPHYEVGRHGPSETQPK